MHLTVVERQLIMQALDIVSLCRLALTCTQLAAEALSPLSGKFLSSPAAVSIVIRPRSLDVPAHRCALVRMHMPVNLRLDQLDELMQKSPAIETAFMEKVASLKRIIELSLWNSPVHWTEVDALRLISLVPHVTQVSGIRTGSIWLQSARVRDALFILPLTRCIGLTTAALGGELPASTLSLASQLHTMMLVLAPTNTFALSTLAVLPALTRLSLMFEAGASRREAALIQFPALLAVDDDRPGTEPTQEQLQAILSGLLYIEHLELEYFASPLQALITLGGPERFPALSTVVCQTGYGADFSIVPAFQATFPKCAVHCQMMSDWDR